MGHGLSEMQREILQLAASLGVARPCNVTAPRAEQRGLVRPPELPLLPGPVRQQQATAASASLYRSFIRLRDRGLIYGTGRVGYSLTDAGWDWLMDQEPTMFPAPLVAEVRELRQAEAARATEEEAAAYRRPA
jgi:hypothetical protein